VLLRLLLLLLLLLLLSLQAPKPHPPESMLMMSAPSLSCLSAKLSSLWDDQITGTTAPGHDEGGG
jgi:hypothetical protein